MSENKEVSKRGRKPLTEEAKAANEALRVATLAKCTAMVSEGNFDTLFAVKSDGEPVIPEAFAVTHLQTFCKDAGKEATNKLSEYVESKFTAILDGKGSRSLLVKFGLVADAIKAIAWPTGSRGRNTQNDERWLEMPDYIGFKRNDKTVFARVDREARTLTVNAGEETQEVFTSPSAVISSETLFGTPATVSGWTTACHVLDVEGKPFTGTGMPVLGDRVAFTVKFEDTKFNGEDILISLNKVLEGRATVGWEPNGSLEKELLKALEPWKFRKA